jgi:predicted nucleic acid-binding protein
MTDFKKVFLDTSLFIYLLEDNPVYCDKVINFIEYCLQHEISFSTSTITHMEFCVRPYEIGRNDVIKDFEELLIDLGITPQPISLPVADTAAKLRAKYKWLRAMDALQLATGICSDCDAILTNDKRIKEVEEIPIILIDDWNKF